LNEGDYDDNIMSESIEKIVNVRSKSKIPKSLIKKLPSDKEINIDNEDNGKIL
jgi:hypothetical protein